MREDLSLDAAAGQRLMLGFDGTRLNSGLKTLIRDYKAGGIILFLANIQSPDQLRALCTDAQSFARDCGQPPLFIAIDQEGGVVARMREPMFREFPGNPKIRTPEEARAFAADCADDLLAAGINMNMAPVMDVVPDGVDSIMKTRAFPGDAGRVAALGCEVIRSFQEKGIMAVAKHFPGIGRTVKDSHLTLPVLEAGRASLEASDLIPFRAAAEAGVAGMMLSHISYPLLDGTWQASLSEVIAREMLREDLGFDGLVMTDDLDMKAITHDMDTSMERLLRADIDMALVCHAGPDIDGAFTALKRHLEADPDLAEMSTASLARISAAKKRYLSS